MKILKPLSSYLSKREFSTNNEHIFLELNYSGVPKDTLEPIENEMVEEKPKRRSRKSNKEE